MLARRSRSVAGGSTMVQLSARPTAGAAQAMLSTTPLSTRRAAPAVAEACGEAT
jgi:hypothetical protein